MMTHLTVLDFDLSQIHWCQLSEWSSHQVDLVGVTLVTVINHLDGCDGLGVIATLCVCVWGVGCGGWGGREGGGSLMSDPHS